MRRDNDSIELAVAKASDDCAARCPSALADEVKISALERYILARLETHIELTFCQRDGIALQGDAARTK